MAKGIGPPRASQGEKPCGGFFELSWDEREAAYAAACERHGVEDFYDLNPAQRAAEYELAVRRHDQEMS